MCFHPHILYLFLCLCFFGHFYFLLDSFKSISFVWIYEFWWKELQIETEVLSVLLEDVELISLDGIFEVNISKRHFTMMHPIFENNFQYFPYLISNQII